MHSFMIGLFLSSAAGDVAVRGGQHVVLPSPAAVGRPRSGQGRPIRPGGKTAVRLFVFTAKVVGCQKTAKNGKKHTTSFSAALLQ